MNLADILLGSASGGALGLLGSVATGVLTFFQKKQDHTFELERLRLTSSLRQGELAGELAKAREQGAAEAFAASVRADGSLKGEHKLVTSFRAFTRPGLTWYFVGLTTWLTVSYIFGFVSLQTIDDPILQFAVVNIYNLTSMMIAWWFGQRQIDKVAIAWGNKDTNASLRTK